MQKYRYKDLDDNNKQYLTSFYYDEDMSHREKMEILCKKFGVGERAIRAWWKDRLNLSEKHTSKISKQLIEAQERQIKEDTNIILVTSAQNKTGVNLRFLKKLKTYRDFLIS